MKSNERPPAASKPRTIFPMSCGLARSASANTTGSECFRPALAQTDSALAPVRSRRRALIGHHKRPRLAVEVQLATEIGNLFGGAAKSRTRSVVTEVAAMSARPLRAKHSTLAFDVAPRWHQIKS